MNVPTEKKKQREDARVDFSVAMCVYGGDNAEFFDRALESITDLQTVKPSEVVLVVDGPVPKAIDDVIGKYEKKYNFFNTIRLPQNGGLGNALRVALENCKYDLIARMDSDDVALPTRFEDQLLYFEQHDEVDVLGGDITEFVDQEDNIVGKRCVPRRHTEIAEYMKRRCAFNHVSVMYKKNAVQGAGGYLDCPWNEDYYLWIRMQLNSAKFANTGTVLVNVRTGADMYARRGGKRYFESERLLQKYMLEHQMIGHGTYVCNVMVRWIVQCCLPNSVRGFMFRHLARSK